MNRNHRALALAIGVPIGAALVGGGLAGNAVTIWYPRLKKSKLVLPLWAFLPVALLYYLMCGSLLYRLLARVAPSPERTAALVLLSSMMAANEGWNYLLFGLRSPRAGLFGMGGFIVITLALYRALGRVDKRSALLLRPYLLWLAYDLVYAYELWRLNPSGVAVQ